MIVILYLNFGGRSQLTLLNHILDGSTILHLKHIPWFRVEHHHPFRGVFKCGLFPRHSMYGLYIYNIYIHLGSLGGKSRQIHHIH